MRSSKIVMICTRTGRLVVAGVAGLIVLGLGAALDAEVARLIEEAASAPPR